MRDTRKILACFAGVLLASAPAVAAAGFPTPVPELFAVALDGPHSFPVQPHFAFDLHGNSFRVWTQGSDTVDDADVFGEMLNAHGQPRGAAFEVNTYRPNYQQSPSVAMNGQGRSVVAWQSFGQDGQITGIYAQRYGPAAVRAGGEITVSPVFPGESANLPSVGMDAAGAFAVAYYNAEGAFVRLFDARGGARGGPIRLSPAPNTSNPSLAMRADGSFAVVWRYALPVGGVEIVGRLFTAAGAPLGREFQINVSAIRGAGVPAVAALPDGGLFVAWDSCDFSDPAEGCAIRARRLAAMGEPLSSELAVSLPDHRAHMLPVVAADGVGNMAVSWDNCVASGPELFCGVSVLFYDPEGRQAPRLWTLEDPEQDLFDATVTAQPGGFVVGFSTSAGAFGWNFLFM